MSDQPSGKPHWRRRQYLINKGLQFRYMSLIIVSLVLVSAFLGWFVHQTTWGMLVERVTNQEAVRELSEIFTKVNLRLIPVILVFLIVISFVSLFLSHSIAGPMYRLERYMKEVGQGRLSMQIRIRRTDELHHFASVMDDMLDSLSTSIKECREEDEKLMEDVNELQDAYLKAGVKDEALGLTINKTNKNVQTLQKSLNKFQIRVAQDKE